MSPTDRIINVLRARALDPNIEEGLIDEDPPQEHETIAAMSHAISLAGAATREAVARQLDAERALEQERRAAAGVRQRLADAVHQLGVARQMTLSPDDWCADDVVRYLTAAIDQLAPGSRCELPLAEVMT